MVGGPTRTSTAPPLQENLPPEQIVLVSVPESEEPPQPLHSLVYFGFHVRSLWSLMSKDSFDVQRPGEYLQEWTSLVRPAAGLEVPNRRVEETM